jgi:hypothetical protein
MSVTAPSGRTGDTYDATITITNNGSAYDLTGKSVDFFIFSNNTKIISSTATISAPLTGVAAIQIPASTMKVKPGMYTCQIKLTNGSIIKTLYAGDFRILDRDEVE